LTIRIKLSAMAARGSKQLTQGEKAMIKAHYRRAFWMAIVLLLINVLVTGLMIHNAEADSVTLAWDPNTPDPDGYRLYQRQDDGSYDYNNPVQIPGVTNQNGDIPADTTTVTLDDLGIICDITDYYWVVRAFVRTDESGDSNEVTMVVDWSCPVTVVNFQASYNYATSEINIGFEQQGSVPVDNWKIYWTRTSGQDYQLFDTIQNDGSNTPTVTRPFTEVADGQRETIYFTVVSFRNDQLYSQNSPEQAVDIDRRSVPQPPTLRRVTIPVQ
jgi:hypothetical protein